MSFIINDMISFSLPRTYGHAALPEVIFLKAQFLAKHWKKRLQPQHFGSILFSLSSQFFEAFSIARLSIFSFVRTDSLLTGLSMATVHFRISFLALMT